MMILIYAVAGAFVRQMTLRMLPSLRNQSMNQESKWPVRALSYVQCLDNVVGLAAENVWHQRILMKGRIDILSPLAAANGFVPP